MRTALEIIKDILDNTDEDPFENSINDVELQLQNANESIDRAIANRDSINSRLTRMKNRRLELITAKQYIKDLK